MPANIPPTIDGYKKVVEDQLGPVWYREVAANPGTTTGTVKLTFELPAAGGRARNLKTVSNDSGVADERIARAAVGRLRVPPIPAAILKAARKDYLAFDESSPFTRTRQLRRRPHR